MARPVKAAEDKAQNAVVNEAEVESKPEQESVEKKSKGGKAEIPDYVDAALKAHPEMQKAWVNPKGFIFTAATPEYMTEGGTLYENKYYQS